MLKRNIIKSEFHNQSFDKKRFWLGIIVGFLSAFAFYCFLNLVCISTRFIFHLGWVGYSIVIPSEFKFYHFIFAFTGLIMGQLVFLEFFINKNRVIKESRFKKFNAFTNTRFAIWGTIFVGFSWAVNPVLLAFSIGSNCYSFQEIGWWVSLLIIIWLQFYVFTQFNKIFNKGFNINLILFWGIAIIAFIFSKIQLVDYAEIYLNRVKNFPHYKLKITPPIVPNKNTISLRRRRSLTKNIFVGDPDKDGIPNFNNISGEEFPFNDIGLYFENFKLKINERNHHQIIANLFIDKDLKMKHVYQLFSSLSLNMQHKVSLAALTDVQNIPNTYYYTIDEGLSVRLPTACLEFDDWQEFLEKNPSTSYDSFKEIFEGNNHNFLCYADIFQPNENEIKIESDGSIFFQNDLVSKEDLYEKLKSISIEKNNQNTFVLNIDPNVNYGVYFFVRHEYQRALNSVRNERALIDYGTEYLFLEKEKQRTIRTNYPIFLIDFFSSEERFIYNFFKEKNNLELNKK